MVNKTTIFPANLIITEVTISSLHTDYCYGIRSMAYYVVKLLTPFNSSWIDIELWMTVFEFKEMLKKSTNQRLRNFVKEKLFEPDSAGCLDIKGWFNKCLHCRDFEFEIIQAINEEIPDGQKNLYTTKGFMDLLR
jgi:hypothetical protein